MLEKIKHFFENHINLANSQGISEDQLRIASAALFMEMMHMDESVEREKQDLILSLLETMFNLTEVQASALIEIAEHNRSQATDYFEFTHLICAEFSHAQKIQLIESLWKIAFIDNNLDVEEEYLVDKVARLLFIPHVEFLEARNRVRAG
ncbi:MAG: TerB family tellurite resistance protein [Methyloglobulus sp.]|nr:TerB family tellurite resistance protein [Methyloglobulus sp.]